MPLPDDDQRWRDVLDTVGEINRALQKRQEQADEDVRALRADIGRLREETTGQMLDYWKATSSAIRQLSDWFAATEDAARKERKIERARSARRAWLIIVLLVLFGSLLLWRLF